MLTGGGGEGGLLGLARPIVNDSIDEVREMRMEKGRLRKQKEDMEKLKDKFKGGEKDADWIPGVKKGDDDDDEPWFTG